MLVSPYIPRRGSSQLRVGRYSERNRIYHVTSTTLFRRKLFDSLKPARILIGAMRNEQLGGHLDSLAFVIMPDHFHWLISLKGDQSLSTCIGRVKSCSARVINKATGRRGRLWQDGFHDRAIRKEEDLVGIARYIIANPLRAGLVGHVSEYPHWDAVWI